MGFERSVAAPGVAELQQRLADNLLRISRETGESEFAVPVNERCSETESTQSEKKQNQR